MEEGVPCTHSRRRVHDRYGVERRVRWKCLACGKTFSESRTTPFFRSRLDEHTILEIAEFKATS